VSWSDEPPGLAGLEHHDSKFIMVSPGWEVFSDKLLVAG